MTADVIPALSRALLRIAKGTKLSSLDVPIIEDAAAALDSLTKERDEALGDRNDFRQNIHVLSRLVNEAKLEAAAAEAALTEARAQLASAEQRTLEAIQQAGFAADEGGDLAREIAEHHAEPWRWNYPSTYLDDDFACACARSAARHAIRALELARPPQEDEKA